MIRFDPRVGKLLSVKLRILVDMVNCPYGMHGEQCGVGAILMAYLHNANWKRIRDALKNMNAPTTARELGATDKEVVKALEMAASIRPERYTILQKLNLSMDAYEKVAMATGVIG